MFSGCQCVNDILCFIPKCFIVKMVISKSQLLVLLLKVTITSCVSCHLGIVICLSWQEWAHSIPEFWIACMPRVYEHYCITVTIDRVQSCHRLPWRQYENMVLIQKLHPLKDVLSSIEMWIHGAAFAFYIENNVVKNPYASYIVSNYLMA